MQCNAAAERLKAPEMGGNILADIVIMGAGLAGAIMAYEMKAQMRPEDSLTVVTKDPV
jgi:glycine/D-amino acid oxidase-like deaminating enzyme